MVHIGYTHIIHSANAGRPLSLESVAEKAEKQSKTADLLRLSTALTMMYDFGREMITKSDRTRSRRRKKQTAICITISLYKKCAFREISLPFSGESAPRVREKVDVPLSNIRPQLLKDSNHRFTAGRIHTYLWRRFNLGFLWCHHNAIIECERESWRQLEKSMCIARRPRN